MGSLRKKKTKKMSVSVAVFNRLRFVSWQSILANCAIISITFFELSSFRSAMRRSSRCRDTAHHVNVSTRHLSFFLQALQRADTPQQREALAKKEERERQRALAKSQRKAGGVSEKKKQPCGTALHAACYGQYTFFSFLFFSFLLLPHPFSVNAYTLTCHRIPACHAHALPTQLPFPPFPLYIRWPCGDCGISCSSNGFNRYSSDRRRGK